MAKAKTRAASRPAKAAKSAGAKTRGAGARSAGARRAKTTRSSKPMPARKAGAASQQRPGKPRLLAGGNPQIPKGEGEGPIQDYIAAMPGWKSDLGRRLDALVTRLVPGVRKAVKWNSPFYGVEGQGWFLNFHVYTKYIKVAFFRGASLHPVPPGASRHEDVRYVDIHEDDFDEAQMRDWIRQAAALPGWLGN